MPMPYRRINANDGITINSLKLFWKCLIFLVISNLGRFQLVVLKKDPESRIKKIHSLSDERCFL